MVILRSLVDLLTTFVEEFGLIGVFLTMAAESCLIPIPSEVVMPFAGYVAWLRNSGEFFIYSVTVATFGNLLGSTALYYIGSRYGRPFVERYGKYFLVSRKELDLAEKWFLRYGAYAVFLGRMAPAIRTVISLPAGIFDFDFKKFAVLTFVGSLPWNFALTYLGYTTGPYWSLIIDQLSYFDVFVVAVAVVAIILYLKLRKTKP